MAHARLVLALGLVVVAVAVAPWTRLPVQVWLLVGGGFLVLAVVLFLRELRRGESAVSALKRFVRNIADVIFGG